MKYMVNPVASTAGRRRLLKPLEAPSSGCASETDTLVRNYLLAEKGSRQKNKLRNQVVGSMLPYVKKIATGLARRQSDPVEDLIQVGNIGLMKALDKFNPLAGSSFKTYATYLITGEIRHYLRDKANMIKPPREMYELYYRINQIVQQLSEKLGRTPSDLEIAEELACPPEKVAQAQETERRRQFISLDYVANSGDGEHEPMMAERLVDEKYQAFLQNQENKLYLEHALKQLSPALRDVVRLSFFEDMSQAEIAEQIGISQMQVSRRLRKALAQLFQSLQVPEKHVPQEADLLTVSVQYKNQYLQPLSPERFRKNGSV